MTLRVYISGQKAFGAAVAQALAEDGHTLVGCASPATNAAGEPDRLNTAAHLLDVPWTDAALLTHRSIPDGTDVIVSAHSHAFLGRHTRNRAACVIGYHPSLLPLHRGRDAVRWAVRDGDRVTGGSVYHLTGRVDAGPIARQEFVIIPPGITARGLWREHLFPLGVRLLTATCRDIAGGTVAYIPQDDSLATWEPSWDRPPLHRPELPELPSPVPGRLRFTAEPANT